MTTRTSPAVSNLATNGRRLRTALVVSFSLLLSANAATGEDCLCGGDFQLNTLTLGDQFAPRVAQAQLAGQNQLALWLSTEDNQLTRLRGAILAFRGAGRGVNRIPFDVDAGSFSGNAWFEPIPFLGQGTFAVAWETGDGDLWARCFDLNTAQPFGDAVQFGTEGLGRGAASTPGLDSASVFWWQLDSNGNEVRRRSVIGAGCSVDTDTGVPLGFDCRDPAVASNSTVEVTACVEDSQQEGALSDIRVLVSDSQGTSSFVANTYTSGAQTQPAIEVSVQDEFLVSWTSAGSPGDDASGESVQARRLAQDGSPIGDQFQVNTETPLDQRNPAVAADPRGNFVVAWESFSSSDSDRSPPSIQTRLVPADGSTSRGDLQVNTTTPGAQVAASVRSRNDGTFFLAWTSDSSSGDDQDGTSAQGRVFDFDFVFADGFESGDVANWSSSIP